MRLTTAILAVCLCLTLVTAFPVADEGFKSQTLDRLMMAETDNESMLRSKRTIGLLRTFFPDVSKMIEDKVNMIIGEVFKIFGPVVLQSFLGRNKNGGGGGLTGGTNSDSGSTVNVKSPFDDDDNDGKSFVDDDDFFSKPKEESGSKVSFELPAVKREDLPKATTTIASTNIKYNVTTNSPVTKSITENIVV